jgi:phosphonate transport system substrate-binding protein
MRRSMTLCLVLAGASGSTCSERPTPPPVEPVLRVAAVTTRPGNPHEQFHALVTYLNERLGVRVEIVPVKKNDTAVELFVRGYVTLAWLDGLGGVRARHEVRGATAIAQGDSDRDHFSFIVAHRRTGLERSIRFPPGLARARFTFGPERSIAEHLMPEYFIWQATGLWPEQFFVRPVGFADSSEQTLARIQSDEYDAGAIDEDVYVRWVETGKVSADVVRVVWRTPAYAMHHWTAHPLLEEQFGAGFTSRVQDALLAIDDPTVLAGLGREHLVPASDGMYDGIRLVAHEHGLLR